MMNISHVKQSRPFLRHLGLGLGLGLGATRSIYVGRMGHCCASRLALSVAANKSSCNGHGRGRGRGHGNATNNSAWDASASIMPFHKEERRSFSSSSSSSSSDDVVVVSIDEARSTTAKALQQIGWDEQDASLQAEIMTAAELCGNNQGLVKMYQPAMMAPAPNAGKPTIERETSNSAVINGNQAPGMLAAVTAADKAVDLLKKNGTAISIVSSYNTSTSSGQLAFYVERIARQGVIGIAMANSPEFVAAAAGGKPVFGTNPLSVGVPQAGKEYPFTFDMATSAIALFGVLSAKAKGEPLPPNVAYDADGNMTTDAATAMEGGAISTFGGHKGAGLALCVELLAGALSGGAVLGQVSSKKEAKSWGHTFIVIDPNALVDDFDQKAASIIDAVKASGDNIRISGERSAQTAVERTAAGVMPIPTKIWESILHTSEHGL